MDRFGHNIFGRVASISLLCDLCANLNLSSFTIH